jgi:GTPase
LQALSEFTDYVQRQQAFRHAPGAENDSSYGTQASSTAADTHDELDSIIDQLGLEEETTSIHLKHVLLDSTDTAEESVSLLTKHITARLAEGSGETLFDLGLEDNGESMGFDVAQWEFALERLREAAKGTGADVSILMTRNVGGNVEVGGVDKNDHGASGKIMIRQIPETVDTVIETRIAVVGNGKLDLQVRDRNQSLIRRSRCG